MAFKTAQDIRDDINTPPTALELSSRYRIAEILIAEQAQYNLYEITFTLGLQETATFTAFMQSQGYFATVIAPDVEVVTEYPIRSPAPGDTTGRVTVGWQKYTATPTVTTVTAGATVTFNVTTEGVPGGTVVYWSILTGIATSDYTPNTGTLTLAPNGSATQIITMSNPLTQAGTLLFKLYRNSARTLLAAEAQAVAVQA